MAQSSSSTATPVTTPRSNTANPDWSQLISSLREADALSQQLLAVLDLERKALEQRDYANFETLLGEKTRLLMALEANTRLRGNWLQQHGFADDRSALKHLEQQLPELAKRWRALAALWQQCQTASRINDQISQRTRMVVGKMLDILSGNAGQGSIYDDKGTTRRAQTGRTITNA